MAFWSKLKFWDKGSRSDFPPMPSDVGNFPGDFNQGFGFPQSPLPGMQGMNSSIEQQQPFRPQQYPTFEPVAPNSAPPPLRNSSFPGSSMQQPDFGSPGKDMNMEVISAKLDALRASLESINQRLANLERAAYGEYEQPQRRQRW